MKIIQTSDWHLWDKHKYSINNSRMKKIIENIQFIIDYAIDNKVKMIIVCGDIFHIYNPNENVMKELAKLTKYAINSGIKMRYIPGDHDTNGEVYSLDTFKTLLDLKKSSDVKIILENYYQETVNNYDIYYVPFQLNLKDKLNSIEVNSKNSLLFSHFALNQAETSTGKKLDAKIKESDIKKWKYVGLGDFHKAQRIGNARYSGSIIKINRGEREDKKSFYVLTLSNKIKIKRVYLDDIEFIDIHISYNDIKKIKLNEFKIDKSFIKLFIYGNIKDGSEIFNLKKRMYDKGASDVSEKIIKENVDEDKKKISFNTDVREASKQFYKDSNKKSKFGLKVGIKFIEDNL